MKIGIYIPGLGQSFASESVEKYAKRLMDEMLYSTHGVEYELKTEKVKYSETKESNVVSIVEKNEAATVFYKIYDFKYHEILTEKFNSQSIIKKNALLLLLFIRKIPLVFMRFFVRSNFRRNWHTLYLFVILLLIASSIILMLPATINIGYEAFTSTNLAGIKDIKSTFPGLFMEFPELLDKDIVPQSMGYKLSKMLIPLTTILLLFNPNAKVIITTLATEFLCANDYIEHGTQKQLVQGNLEKLIDYISENEPDCKIHFHTYSFGSLLAIDYIYPFGNTISHNANQFCEAIITIGTPFEFVQSYYSRFYKKRKKELGDQLCWLNVYSTQDMLATNFRKDMEADEASFGIDKMAKKPININYELAPKKIFPIISFLTLYNIKVHGMYWDSNSDGQSCLRLVYAEMKKNNLI